MKIAYLVLCHTDINHVKRLAKKLTKNNCNSVYIHIDKKVNDQSFHNELSKIPSVYIVEDNVKVFWGGYSSVEATLRLIECAVKNGNYDRYILLQGLDYPLVSNEQISKFFIENKDVEFIRACNITKSRDKYHYSKCRYYWFYDNINILKRCLNFISKKLDLKIRRGYIFSNNKKYDIYWGAAQWALTEDCIKYILNFKNNNPRFNKYFKHVFPPDETYFHTIIFNSKFKQMTTNKKEESEKKYLVNWRNLHYFEYDGFIKVFNHRDFEFLKERSELFIRKVNSKESKYLLDMIDSYHEYIK